MYIGIQQGMSNFQVTVNGERRTAKVKQQPIDCNLWALGLCISVGLIRETSRVT
jgi:hypothetical protein